MKMIQVGVNRWADQAHAARLGLKAYVPPAAKAPVGAPAARPSPVARPSAPTEPTPEQVRRITQTARKALIEEVWQRFRDHQCPVRMDVMLQIVGDE